MQEKPKVYISRKLEKSWFSEVYKNCSVKMHAKSMPPARAEFFRESKKVDGVISSLTEKVDAEFFKSNPNVKIVANYAVGYDNIDIISAKKAGVFVSNTPGEYSGAVAEHAMALILNVARRVLESDKFIRQGKYKAWDAMLFLGNDIRGATLGIIGTGRIGSALVNIASRGFKMKILYHDVVPNKEIEKDLGAKKVSIEELLKKSDYVSLHVPLLPSTRHLIGKKELEKMKPTSYLINTSRGPVVDEKALVQALKSKKIAGAGLDVYENEPKLSQGLSNLSNVVLTPHTASATFSSRKQMAEIASQNILDVLVRGKEPVNQIK